LIVAKVDRLTRPMSFRQVLLDAKLIGRVSVNLDIASLFKGNGS
jgi:hypothetical protein